MRDPGFVLSTRLLLCIDNVLLHQSVARALQPFGNLEVVEDPSAISAFDGAADLRPPDAALVCSTTSVNYLMANIARIRLTSPQTRILALLPLRDTELLGELRTVGVTSFGDAQTTLEELLALLDEIRIAPPPGQVTTEQIELIRIRMHCHHKLSAREREIVNLVAQALSNRQIASALRITEGTVKRHMQNIFTKLGANSRIDAVNKATAETCNCSPKQGRICGENVPKSPHCTLSGEHCGTEHRPLVTAFPGGKR